MVDAWLTTMSPNLLAVINPLTAACEEEFIPDTLYVLENPGVCKKFDDITSMMERVVIEYDGDENGIVVIHRNSLHDVTEAAESIEKREHGVRRRIE